MTKSIITAAQIGCGKFAWAQDLNNMTAHKKVNLKWACDVCLDNAKKAAEHFNIPCVTDNFMDVINDPEVDMIKIATTHEVHLPIIRAAAAAGKHIFCEKPMAMYDDEAFQIIDAVRKGKVKLCVDLNRRMSPAMQALRKKYLAHMSNPQHNPWQYVETVREPMAEEKFPHMSIRIQDESSSYGMGHMHPLTGGGVIIGESVHWLDLACWFFAPALPCEITAWGSSRLSHGIHLKFNDGASMTLDFSCAGTFDYPKEQYEVTGGAALFRSLHFVENNYYGMPDNPDEYFKPQFDPLSEMGEGHAAFIAKNYANVANSTNSKKVEQTTPLMPDKGHRAMLDAFVEAIINDLPSPCDELAGYRSTLLARKAIEAIRLRQTLPLQLEDIDPSI
ncbi:MAG: Gfo/Idh/MocA family oxidoreductase [Lentisphaerae bacterium]|nr:Gfo/Idh/MocA family oxidoreductase [Lentisphaerota bacterium]